MAAVTSSSSAPGRLCNQRNAIRVKQKDCDGSGEERNGHEGSA